jgi:hypothetical protein
MTPFGHTYLVATPIVVHSVSALAKRVLAPRAARRLGSALALTGYAGMLLFVPAHYIIHRVLPSAPDAPVAGLSPSELDYEYVKYGLREWPGMSWFLYAGLVLGIAWHAAEGAQLMWNAYLRGRFGGWRSSLTARAATVAAVSLPVLSGVYVMWTEPLMALTSSVARFEAAYTQSPIFTRP